MAFRSRRDARYYIRLLERRRWDAQASYCSVALGGNQIVEGSELVVTLDLERLDRIRQLLRRRPRSFDELLGLFLSEAYERVRELGEALGKGDPAAAATLAHGLRGSSSAFGALRLAGLCREFEQLGQARGLAGVREAFPALEAELAAVSCELKSTLG